MPHDDAALIGAAKRLAAEIIKTIRIDDAIFMSI